LEKKENARSSRRWPAPEKAIYELGVASLFLGVKGNEPSRALARKEIS